MHGGDAVRYPLILLLPLAACAPRLLPPPASPERAPPSARDPGPSPAGRSRVYIDVPAEPARVDEVTGVTEGWSEDSDGNEVPTSLVTTRTLCTAPCAVDLSFGAHRLVLHSLSDASRGSEVIVSPAGRPLAVRAALGRELVHSTRWLAGILGFSLGGGLVAGGLPAYLVGRSEARAAEVNPFNPSMGDGGAAARTVGLTLMVAGAVAIVAGIVSFAIARGETQPGSATVWELGGPASAGSWQPDPAADVFR